MVELVGIIGTGTCPYDPISTLSVNFYPTRPLQVEGQQPLQNALVRDVVGPGVGVEDGVVQLAVGEV